MRYRRKCYVLNLLMLKNDLASVHAIKFWKNLIFPETAFLLSTLSINFSGPHFYSNRTQEILAELFTKHNLLRVFPISFLAFVVIIIIIL